MDRSKEAQFRRQVRAAKRAIEMLECHLKWDHVEDARYSRRANIANIKKHVLDAIEIKLDTWAFINKIENNHDLVMSLRRALIRSDRAFAIRLIPLFTRQPEWQKIQGLQSHERAFIEENR